MKNSQLLALQERNLEIQRLTNCVRFWESRIIRGWLGLFFPFHNLHCLFEMDKYRERIIQHKQRSIYADQPDTNRFN